MLEKALRFWLFVVWVIAGLGMGFMVTLGAVSLITMPFGWLSVIPATFFLLGPLFVLGLWYLLLPPRDWDCWGFRLRGIAMGIVLWVATLIVAVMG